MLLILFSDDSWLDLTPEALDELMKEAAGLQVQTQPDQLDLNKVAESMNTFVNKVSGLEGVEFPRLVVLTLLLVVCM